MPEHLLGRFGDRRLAATANALLEAMQKQQTMCLHGLADSREQKRRFNDFLDNEAVTRQEMLTHAGRLSAQRAAGRNVVVVSDTSEHNYAHHTGRKHGFGTVGNGVDIGVLIHPLVALDAATGGVIGLVGAEVINRPAGKVSDHKTRATEQKESRRWLAGVETAGDVLADAALITMVEDREGDIYDQFARRPANVHLLIRAAQNRALAGGEKLFETRTGWSEAARHTITVPAKGGGGRSHRAGRSATVVVRFGEVTLLRPRCAGGTLPQSLTLRVVDVCEIDPPEPQQRVRWCLLTTHAVSTP
ncbi:MAG: hypothetical protein ACREF3_16490, partial [Acetobacteraceae bacterium]